MDKDKPTGVIPQHYRRNSRKILINEDEFGDYFTLEEISALENMVVQEALRYFDDGSNIESVAEVFSTSNKAHTLAAVLNVDVSYYAFMDGWRLHYKIESLTFGKYEREFLYGAGT